MKRSNPSRSAKHHDNPRKPNTMRKWWTLSAIGASVLAGLVLLGGFAYGTYAALGGAMKGQSLATTSNTTNDNASSSTHNGTGSSTNRIGTSPANNAAGLGSGGAPHSASRTASPRKGPVHLVALGDSLAHGFGDASGRGFVGDVGADYRAAGATVMETNLGIDGLTSDGLLQELKQSSVQTALSSATVILLSIGGNDLNNAAGFPNISRPRIAAAQSHFQKNLTSILQKLRQENQTAPILLVGLYNPYADFSSQKRETDSIVQSWDATELQTAEKSPKTVVVQTYDLFELHGSEFLYYDNFHPNQAGYQRIAARIWQDLQT